MTDTEWCLMMWTFQNVVHLALFYCPLLLKNKNYMMGERLPHSPSLNLAHNGQMIKAVACAAMCLNQHVLIFSLTGTLLFGAHKAL